MSQTERGQGQPSELASDPHLLIGRYSGTPKPNVGVIYCQHGDNTT